MQNHGTNEIENWKNFSISIDVTKELVPCYTCRIQCEDSTLRVVHLGIKIKEIVVHCSFYEEGSPDGEEDKV
jgi:hypothetical protein